MTLTIIAIILFLLLSVGFYKFATEMVECNKGFKYFAWGMILLIIAFAVYLTYAVPSFAKFGSNARQMVTQDESNLLIDE